MAGGKGIIRPAGILLAALALLLAGVLSGRWLTGLILLLAGTLAWQLFNAWKLHRWLHSSDGKLPSGLGIWSRIFDRIDALQEQNLRQTEQLETVIEEFQNVTNAFPDATLVLDKEDHIAWSNDAASTLLGLKIPEDMGRPVTNLLRDPDFVNWLAVQDRVESKLEMACPIDENIHLSISAVRYREGQRLLILRNVTDIHSLEQIRRDFVANVSHELRTPLTVLLGYLEDLPDHLPNEVRPALNKMQEQAWQMQDLLNDLLEISRLQGQQTGVEEADVDIPALLMQLKEQAEALSQGEHRIRVEIQPGLHLRGIAADLESAFRNLVDNAVHYTAGGGSIVVRWEQTEEGPALSVSDTGIGIPKRDIPRLTERFYRVGSGRSRNSSGTGLGLSIVKHVLNAHQARLLVESELGSGSRFTCVFPAGRSVNHEPGHGGGTA